MYYLKLGRRILSALAVFCGSFAFAADYYVSTTGSDENDGSSAETAVATIDKAIGLATSKDDTIHVAPGTYQTTTKWGPNLLATMVGTGTSRDEVVIESAGSYRTLRMAADSVVRHLTLVGNKDYKADKGGAVEMSGGLLEDCVIKDGTASNSSTPEGGNVYLNGDGIVRNCMIIGGKAKKRGGNVYVEKGTVEDCKIREGYSGNEAGNLYLAYGLVSKCTIADGSALGDGGNIRAYDNSNGQIVDCVISGGKILAVKGDDGKWPEKKGANAFIKGSTKLTRCQFLGGSYNENGYDCGSLCLYYPGSGSIVEDCLIKGSSCGGALLAGTTYIYNTTIVDNERYGVWSWGTGKNFYNTILYGNALAGVLRDYAGDKPSKNVFGLAVTSGGVFKSGDYSNGVILLEDSAAFADYEKGDYHLVKGSVLVDVGTDDPRTDASETDLDGKPRVANQVLDIGCYEYQPVDFTVGFSMSYDTNNHAPAGATFEAVPLNAGGAVTYTWDFGDGSERVTTTETTVAHMFEKTGKFTVTLTAESADETAIQTREELAVIYDTFVWVSTTGTATFPYNTEATALRAIDSAISVHASAGGGEIRVAPGTYETAWQYNLDKECIVKGMGESPEEVVVKNTTKADTKNPYRRVFQVASEGARVENLTMEGGSVYNQFGGNVRITAGTVANCIIRGGLATANAGNGAGGGVEVAGTGLLTHCKVIDNVVEGTSADTWAAGGAIFIPYGSSGKVSNTLVANNKYVPSTPNVRGSAGIQVGGSNEKSVIENCTIVANMVEGSISTAAGVWSDSSWYTTFRNCVIAGNYQTEPEKTMSSVRLTSNTKVYNCVVDVMPETTEYYGNSTGLVLGDVKTMFKDFENGDYTPKPGSVLANKGASALSLPTDKDLAGNPRVFDSKIDIGCYEVQKNSGLVIIIR